MNKLMCRVTVGIASLAVLGTIATPAGAQIDEVKEKPRLYRYVSYWNFPRDHWADVVNENLNNNQKIFAPALACSAVVGYGDEENKVHYADGFTHANWWQSNSIAGLMKVLESFDQGGDSSPLLVSSTKHWDQIYLSRFYNWKAGSWKGAYRYTATYALKPEWPNPDDALQTLSAFDVPLFERLLADGTIVEYELDREWTHPTDSPVKFVYVVVTPNAEQLDKMAAAVRSAVGANSLIGPAFASMTVNQTPQINIVRVNATYK